VARKTKSLAGNHKTECECFGTHQRRRVTALAAKPNVIWQNRTMTRDDVLVWLSLAGLFAAYCATFWVLFPL